MAKKYNSNWNAKKLTVDFNQKQWRQDFAAYVKEKKFWDVAKVTRAKIVSNNSREKGIKYFEIFNTYGGNIVVTFSNNYQIVNSNEKELITEYLKEKGISNE